MNVELYADPIAPWTEATRRTRRVPGTRRGRTGLRTEALLLWGHLKLGVASSSLAWARAVDSAFFGQEL